MENDWYEFGFLNVAADAFARPIDTSEPDTGKFVRREVVDLARLDDFYVSKVVLEQR